jgi:hypothetical protein
MCLASVVAFRAAASDEVAFRTASGKVLRVRGNATVRISNNPREDDGRSHFHMYAKLLEDATSIDEPVHTGSCTGGRRRVTTHSSTLTNCSNSIYP